MKVLFISIAAPPKTGPESIQVSKVLEELLAQNVEVKFLTEKIGYNSWSTNVSSKMVEDSSLEVHEIPTHNSLVNKLSNKPLFKEIFYPDNKFLFHRRILSQNLFKDIDGRFHYQVQLLLTK
ncbi:hypothetical protein SAMN05661096_02877 [Marivirga sericea]|uniref:Uncharacterized protein n=1 Tax=Marivirga sericea TaxID=1028 RepID=A0A1X7KM66_9BACT|nr:hypothetical protein [Marivirga sericea]SMG42248.1 hypothetical protein SAMN05661096_02877 [Marivirga sericea]